MNSLINQEVLVSGAEHFDIVPLNPHVKDTAFDRTKVIAEHAGIVTALEDAGISVVKVGAPAGCHAGVFTANWAVCYGDTAVMSNLPGPRKREEQAAERALQGLGKEIVKPPYLFSGQGDALRCGNILLTATGYRTDPRMPAFLSKIFPDLEVVSLETVPELDAQGKPVINKLSGLRDSLFYDLDLAASVLREDLIGWCPDAFTDASKQKIRELPVDKIEVPLEEAVGGMACNLVSTGKTAIMSGMAPRYRADIEAHGLTTVTPDIAELVKSGGCIRCTTLTLS